MGSSLEKDFMRIKEDRDTIPVLNWRDWVKREPPDEVLQSYFTVVLRHIDAIEGYLEKGDLAAGRAFVRPQERPAVGNEALHQGLQAIEQRIQQIESNLGSKR